ILPRERFAEGRYELVFQAGAYLLRVGLVSPDTLFLDDIPIRFTMSEPSHYHVPLLLSPFGMSTYRGS
ncbi:MAG: hydroxyisourate hydrolase, partial [Pseudomonadota bacterium]